MVRLESGSPDMHQGIKRSAEFISLRLSYWRKRLQIAGPREPVTLKRNKFRAPKI